MLIVLTASISEISTEKEKNIHSLMITTMIIRIEKNNYNYNMASICLVKYVHGAKTRERGRYEVIFNF